MSLEDLIMPENKKCSTNQPQMMAVECQRRQLEEVPVAKAGIIWIIHRLYMYNLKNKINTHEFTWYKSMN